MRIITSVLLLLSGLSFQVHAQWCGMTIEDMAKTTNELLECKKNILTNGTASERGTVFVPVKFHLVGNDDGTSRVLEYRVLDLLCGWNKNYAPLDYQFYMKGGFNYINDININTDPRNGFTAASMRSKKDAGAMNVFIVKNIPNPSSPTSKILGFFDYAGDYVVILATECKTEASTISHEAGHFFRLLHTHNGWDGHPYDPTVDADSNFKVNDYSPEQGVKKGTYPGQGSIATLKNECMSGFEGELRGDYMSDTPPDYAMGEASAGKGTANCTLHKSLIAIDPCGDTVKPMTNNYMSYFEGCSAYQFTPQQVAVVKESYNSTKRAYLRTNTPPVDNGTVSGAPILMSPANNGYSVVTSDILLDWQDVPNATSYLVEVSLITSMGGSNSDFYIVNNASELVFKSFKGQPIVQGKFYYWRVRAYNNNSCCTAFSSTFKFTAGPTSIKTIDSQVANMNIYPNPVISGQELKIDIKANKNFDGVLKVHDGLGRLLHSEKITVSEGDNSINLPSLEITSGAINVGITIGHEVIGKNVIIQR